MVASFGFKTSCIRGVSLASAGDVFRSEPAVHKLNREIHNEKREKKIFHHESFTLYLYLILQKMQLWLYKYIYRERCTSPFIFSFFLFFFWFSFLFPFLKLVPVTPCIFFYKPVLVTPCVFITPVATVSITALE